MQENEIIQRIKSLCEARSWTLYRLAKESGITYSTLCTMIHKSNIPSVPTLVKLCNGFGITLSDFFGDSANRALLTDGEKEHLQRWNQLSAENQQTAEKYIVYLLSEQDKNK